MGAVTKRFFDGRESWVFRAQTLDELCGFHPDLIAQALASDEHVDYLLYSPLREVDEGPLGLRDACGSHALAVTGDCMIVSRDPHQPRQSRAVCRIPFVNILAIELGEALTLGWLVIRFVAAGQATSEVIFFQSTGIEHFRAAVRAWRQNVSATLAHPSSPDPGAWSQVWSQTPPHLRSQLAPVLLESERPHVVIHSVETWRPAARRRRPLCLSAPGLCVVTDEAVLLADSEPPHRPGVLAFAVTVRFLDRRVIRDVVTRSRRSRTDDVMDLAFDLAVGSVRHEVTMSLGRPATRDLEDLRIELRRSGSERQGHRP